MAMTEEQYEKGKAVLTPDGIGYMAGLDVWRLPGVRYPRELQVQFKDEIRLYRLEDCYTITFARYLFGNQYGFGRIPWGNMLWIYGLLMALGAFARWHPVWIVTTIVVTIVIVVQSWMQFRLKVR